MNNINGFDPNKLFLIIILLTLLAIGASFYSNNANSALPTPVTLPACTKDLKLDFSKPLKTQCIELPGPEVPDAKFGTGAVNLKRTEKDLCSNDFSTSGTEEIDGKVVAIRDVSESLKNQIYTEYGIKRVPYGYEIDHIISLIDGGSNDKSNLFPQKYIAYNGHDARHKDVLEVRLHTMMCDHKLSLEEIQKILSNDWITGYEKYVGSFNK